MSTPEWMTDGVVEQAGDIICDVLDSHGHNGVDCRPDAGFDLHCAEAFRAALAAVLPDLLRQAKAEALRELRDYLAAPRRVWFGDLGVRVALDIDDPRSFLALSEYLDLRADRIEQGDQP